MEKRPGGITYSGHQGTPAHMYFGSGTEVRDDPRHFDQLVTASHRHLVHPTNIKQPDGLIVDPAFPTRRRTTCYQLNMKDTRP